MTAREVAQVLREIAQLLELKGENAFKVRAYQAGAEAFEAMPADPGAAGGLLERVRTRSLGELSGVGKAIEQKVTELVETGRLAYLDELRREFPHGALDLVRVPGLGPKRALALIRELDVGSLEDLVQACEQGRVRALKGFGAKTEAQLLEGVRKLRERTARRPLWETRPAAERLLALVRAAPGVHACSLAGSVRRFSETSGDVDLVAELEEGARVEPVMEAFCAAPEVAEVIARGETKSSLRLSVPQGLQADLRVVSRGQFGTALHHFTGSKAHHVKLRGLARQKGLTISEYALAEIESGRPRVVPDEAALYRELGLPFIPPELREDQGEIEAAQTGTLPHLITAAAVQGLLHCHTNYSDGANTIEELARAAVRLGKSYLAITDHVHAGGALRGITVDSLQRQAEEIALVQERVPSLRILRGVEVDVLADGSLALPDSALAGLELVIASVHHRHQLDREAQTQRVLRALAHPLVDIWGHPTGRLLGERDEMEVDMEALLLAAAKHRVAVECNGAPHRLDLGSRWLLRAREHGCRIAISVDAHETAGFANLDWAIGTARRGWVEEERVVNARPVEEMLALLAG